MINNLNFTGQRIVSIADSANYVEIQIHATQKREQKRHRGVQVFFSKNHHVVMEQINV